MYARRSSVLRVDCQTKPRPAGASINVAKMKYDLASRAPTKTKFV